MLNDTTNKEIISSDIGSCLVGAVWQASYDYLEQYTLNKMFKGLGRHPRVDFRLSRSEPCPLITPTKENNFIGFREPFGRHPIVDWRISRRPCPLIIPIKESPQLKKTIS